MAEHYASVAAANVWISTTFLTKVLFFVLEELLVNKCNSKHNE